jgi:hypothetical protein
MQRVWGGVTLALALSLAGFIISQIKLAQLIELWRQAKAIWLVGYVLALYASVWVIGRRYWTLMGRTVPFHSFLEFVVLQVVIGNVLLAPAGTAAFVAGLRGRHDVAVRRSLAALVLARAGDLLAATAFLAAGSAVLWPEIELLHTPVGLLIGLGGCLVLLFAALIAFRDRFVDAVARVLDRVGLRKVGIVGRLLAGLEAAAELDEGQWRGAVVSTSGYSLLALAFTSLSFYCVVSLLSTPLGVWQCVFIMSLLQMVLVVPIHVLGGLGVSDITVLYLLRAFRPDHAAPAALVVSMKLVFYATNVCMLGYVPLGRLWARLRMGAPPARARGP